MSNRFRSSLDALISHDPDAVADVVDREEARYYSEVVPTVAANEDEFVGASPLGVLLESPVASINDFSMLVRAVEPRWRLDAIVAVDEYLSTDASHDL